MYQELSANPNCFVISHGHRFGCQVTVLSEAAAVFREAFELGENEVEVPEAFALDTVHTILKIFHAQNTPTFLTWHNLEPLIHLAHWLQTDQLDYPITHFFRINSPTIEQLCSVITAADSAHMENVCESLICLALERLKKQSRSLPDHLLSKSALARICNTVLLRFTHVSYV